jgi:hypothetical protein
LEVEAMKRFKYRALVKLEPASGGAGECCRRRAAGWWSGLSITTPNRDKLFGALVMRLTASCLGRRITASSCR